jgi:signal peptide peptidase SppA, 67K type
MWRAVNFTRLLLLNLIFVAIVLSILIGLRQEKPDVTIHDGALVLDLAGKLVEQSTTPNPADQLMQKWLSDSDKPREIAVGDVVYAIQKAKTDPHVKGIVLKTADLESTSIGKLLSIAHALDDFRQSKKPVVAVGNFYQQHQYLLAAHADTILLNPAGAVTIQGLGLYNLYFKSALDKFNLTPHVFRVGTYKSFVEPYIRDDMSPEAREANQRWLGSVWQQYVTDVSTARHIPADAIAPTKEQVLSRLAKAEGNAAQYALDQGLVDQLATHDEMVDTIRDFAGSDKHDFRRIDMDDYLQSLPPRYQNTAGKPQIGLLIAAGTIVDSSKQANNINGEELAKQIRGAMYNDKIKALVLRIDSPGGSAFAAEQIRTALLAFKATGKPLVVSMGSVAASGGYWIAADADKIYAEPATITGSIGVFGMFLTADKALNALGVHTDGLGTTDFTGISPTQPLPEHIKQIVQMNVENTYQRFLDLVAEGRGMTPEQVDSIAQGRVWVGTDAKKLGLVDELGGLDQAFAAAGKLAKLTDYQITPIEPELSTTDKLLRELFDQSAEYLPSTFTHSALGQLALQWWSLSNKALAPLNALQDPQGIYSYCPVCQQ